MNQKLVDKDITVPVYKALFRRFASQLPEAWLYILESKDLDKYWRDGGNF